jgi:hypothetical protein
MQTPVPDLFVITSVINTGNAGWTYTDVRSVFNCQERFEQTLNSIASIRSRCSGASILLIECSDIDDTMTQALKERVDYFIQTYHVDEIREACINSNKKGYGEMKKMAAVCDFIASRGVPFKRLFKLSGRYFLNDSFTESVYSTEQYTFMKYAHDAGSTVLYSVPYALFHDFHKTVHNCVHYYEHNPARGLETLLPFMCAPCTNIKTLGVSGYVAVKNDSGGSDFYSA